MNVVFHKSPRIHAEGMCSTKIGRTFKEIFSIFFIAKYRYSINAPAHHMMEGTGCIKSWLPWHTKASPFNKWLSNCFGTNVPFYFLYFLDSSRYKMKSVERNLELLSVTIDFMIRLFASVSLAATRARMVKTLRASDTDRVPSAESFLPVNGNVSGPRWHWLLMLTRQT